MTPFPLNLFRLDSVYLIPIIESCHPHCRWEFKTEDYDIGFGVLHIVDGKSHPVKPVERVNSHVVAEDGSINCDKIGTCKCLMS